MTNVTVIGATGRIGAPAMAALAAKGAKVTAMTRSADKAAKLPPGVIGVVGDLEQPASLGPVFAGADAVLLITANGETETARGLAAVAAAKAAKVRRLVFVSVVHVPGVRIPHFDTKLPIEAAIRESGIAAHILRPNFFYQNDLLAKTGLLKFGVYAHPIGRKGQNRIDCADIAAAAANLLTQSGGASAEHMLHGPETLDADQVAAIFAKHLGRPIRYGGDDLDAWENASKAFMPPWLVHSLKVMYADMQARGAVATEAQVAHTRALVGRELSRFEPWAANAVAGWG
jgi:uncharacterized protein YbjT (DUF2867 family)